VPDARVLVIDDDDPSRTMIRKILTREGYEVEEASDGEEALELLGSWHPDVILLDLMMPWMDGQTFRDQQRRRPELAEIPVVVVTAARDAEARARLMGPAAVVTKPFHLDTLLDAVEQATRRENG